MNIREALGTVSGAGQALSVCYLFGLLYGGYLTSSELLACGQ